MTRPVSRQRRAASPRGGSSGLATALAARLATAAVTVAVAALTVQWAYATLLASVSLARARRASEEGRHREAESLLARMTEPSELHAEAQYYLGRALFARGDLTGAARALERAQATIRDYLLDHDLAVVLAKLGCYDRAWIYADRGYRFNPADGGLRTLLARLEVTRARLRVLPAGTVRPNEAEICAVNNRKPRPAASTERLLARAESLGPEEAELRRSAGQVWLSIGHDAQAEASFRAVLRRERADATAILGLAEVLARPAPAGKSAGGAATAHRRREALTLLLSLLQSAQLSAGDLQHAVWVLEGLREQDPENIPAAIYLARAQLRSGGAEAAVRTAERALAHAEVAELHYVRGAALQALGNSPAAVAAYARAVELLPQHLAARAALAAVNGSELRDSGT